MEKRFIYKYCPFPYKQLKQPRSVAANHSALWTTLQLKERLRPQFESGRGYQYSRDLSRKSSTFVNYIYFYNRI